MLMNDEDLARGWFAVALEESLAVNEARLSFAIAPVLLDRRDQMTDGGRLEEELTAIALKGTRKVVKDKGRRWVWVGVDSKVSIGDSVACELVG